ncbi:hypothetical protein [Dyadobacter tibetensis]|uniref:hypothetical protein n=1 Tax=Dyadobacter tibetensis TaxID=1211851 RepID=UPI00103F1CCF|nr:hypothetical protein [Dyadobacter tibetensis]
MHKKQEQGFKSVMSADISNELRRICACGHMSSVLFLNEICTLYESLKNCLEDRDLDSIVMSRTMNLGKDGVKSVLQQLFYTQQDLLNAYNELVEGEVLGGEALLFCQDHFAQLLRLDAFLKKEVRSYELGTKTAYQVVA